ncbi:YXWGXW repeat-containing protein [Comamonas sp. BIGb0124]|uniref:YXWGXW repeat-containing protein n=1 Tax=Comamonas sp. BIGb0124 TaxID=2485130 RepID=UPI000F47958A|nr:YXWGXW repeat-containing protein [Comamonas sp. BIGb0124]ROR18580.1 YXWGXW repeat-containing protein [Comamonas sp. BIGb0124]
MKTASMNAFRMIPIGATRAAWLAAAVGTATLVSACVVAPPRAHEAVSYRVEVAPPPPRVEVIPAPRSGYVWAPGYWSWDPQIRRHVWLEGRWEVERPRAHYVPAHWRQEGPGWVFVPGRWDR